MLHSIQLWTRFCFSSGVLAHCTSTICAYAAEIRKTKTKKKTRSYCVHSVCEVAFGICGIVNWTIECVRVARREILIASIVLLVYLCAHFAD